MRVRGRRQDSRHWITGRERINETHLSDGDQTHQKLRISTRQDDKICTARDPGHKNQIVVPLVPLSTSHSTLRITRARPVFDERDLRRQTHDQRRVIAIQIRHLEPIITHTHIMPFVNIWRPLKRIGGGIDLTELRRVRLAIINTTTEPTMRPIVVRLTIRWRHRETVRSRLGVWKYP